VVEGGVLPWKANRYDKKMGVLEDSVFNVLTPVSTVNAIRLGFAPAVR